MNTLPDLSYTFDRGFERSLYKLDPRDQKHVTDALEKYRKSPETPGLKLRKLKGKAGKNQYWRIYASEELRVLLVREGPTSVFLRAGHHDAIYRFADQWTLTSGRPDDGVPGLIATKSDAVDLDGSPPASRRPVGQRAPDSEYSILVHWGTPDLLKVGFDKEQVHLLRRADQDTLLDVWPDIDDDTLNNVMKCLEQSPDEFFQRQLIADDVHRHERFREAIMERGALGGLSTLLTSEEFHRLISAPIEDWMIFLHPDQRTLADRHFNGPARVRGAAGTGKTVVALHRAAVLAKRFLANNGQSREHPLVLFTTFIKSLPPVFENLYQRLPSAAEGAVEFINVDKLAHRICTKYGQPPRLDTNIVDKTFDAAFTVVIRNGTPLNQAGLTRKYLREEVTVVLKGRGVDSLEEYRYMERTGRWTRFTQAMREQAWELRKEWDRRLDEAGKEDFPDVTRRARDIARQQQEPMYRAAIIDESQDLSLVGLQIIRALVSGADGQDRPDALFIVGDAAQKIYPGGFTLAQAGIDVRGNSSILRVNYRNTHEIIDAAMACAGSEPVDDLGDEYARGDADAEAVRGSGVKPCFVRASKFSDQVAYVVEKIQQFRESQDVGFGDIGIFAATNSGVKRILEKFGRTQLHFQELKDIEGRPNDLIKIGTFHRAKGLEFKVVFLFGISEKSFPARRRTGETDAEYDERKALEIRQFFVAMTRARDGLFLLCDDAPSEVLYKALDFFEEEEA